MYMYESVWASLSFFSLLSFFRMRTTYSYNGGSWHTKWIGAGLLYSPNVLPISLDIFAGLPAYLIIGIGHNTIEFYKFKNTATIIAMLL